MVIDRYHTAKLYRNALDGVRARDYESTKILPAEEYSELKDMMWILRKQYECLSEEEKPNWKFHMNTFLF